MSVCIALPVRSNRPPSPRNASVVMRRALSSAKRVKSMIPLRSWRASLMPPRETNAGRSATLTGSPASTSSPGFCARRRPRPTCTSPAITEAAARLRDGNRPRSVSRVSRRRFAIDREPLHKSAACSDKRAAGAVCAREGSVIDVTQDRLDRGNHGYRSRASFSPEPLLPRNGPLPQRAVSFKLSAAGRWATMHGWLVDERGQRLRDLCRR